MSKLLKFKEWLTLEDTAKRMTAMFQEPVTEADVLRLALDGHMTLSVNLVNGADVAMWDLVPIDQVPVKRLHMFGEDQLILDGLRIDDESALRQLDDGKVSRAHGVWDIPLFGAAMLDAEHLYQSMTSGVAITGTYLDGAFVRSETGQYAQILERYDSPEMKQLGTKLIATVNALRSNDRPPIEPWQPTLREYRDPRNYFPKGGLPESAVFVVRATVLMEFEARMRESDPQPADVDKPLLGKERNTLYAIIAALLKNADLSDKITKQAEQIEVLAAQIGQPISRRAIQDHLSRITKQLKGE